MKTFTAEQLQEILQKHKPWLGGKHGGKRVDLRLKQSTEANLQN
jgi:hypothetical protein